MAAEDSSSTATGPFTVQVPLGETGSASVYLVRSERPRGLLRLKTWHTQAPAGFVKRFEGLHANLDAWSHPLISNPLRAWVDAAGRPSVLSAFRKGVPMLDCVRSGRLETATASSLLAQLRDATVAGHARGLVHGSIVPGNVLVDTSGGAVYLLDFGLASLLLSSDAPALSPAIDEAGFVSLERTLRELGGGSSGVSL
jgi:serine/threonine-protein kinase